MARILLVEDDLDVRPLLKHVLLGAGHDVVDVETVANATLALDKTPFDLVVTDGKLPDGSGLEVGDKAKALRIPVLLLTGWAFQLPQERLKEFDYLLKPVRPTELFKAIERLLANPEGDAEVVPFPKPGG